MAKPSSPDVSTIDERLAGHFLRRLRRASEHAALEAATAAGILERRDVAVPGGRQLVVYRPGPARHLTAMDVRRILCRARQNIFPLADSIADDEPGMELSAVDEGAIGPDDSREASSTKESESARAVSVASLLSQVSECAGPSAAPGVAKVLLLARAVARSGAGLADILTTLRLERPIIIVRSGITGFERAFLGLLKGGHILPGENRCFDGYNNIDSSDYLFQASPALRHIICFAGKDFEDDALSWLVDKAAASPHPILAVTEDTDLLPKRLAMAAQPIPETACRMSRYCLYCATAAGSSPFLCPDAGHDRLWVALLEGGRTAALSKAWRGGSIRKLEWLMEVVIKARERGRAWQ